jgi:hypothetical protein
VINKIKGGFIMDSTSNGITPVMNMGNDGFGSGFMGLFGLLILLGIFNGGFGGFGGNNQQYATRDQVQQGFDNQNMQMQTSGILSAVNAGTAQAVAATNQSFHDSLAAMQSLYNETARDIAGLAVGQSNILANQNSCCCSTKQMIADAGASLSAQIAQSKYDTSMQMAGLEQKILSKMDANEITALRDQVNQLQLAQATSGMLRFPNSWSYGAGAFPPIFGGCCGNGNI